MRKVNLGRPAPEGHDDCRLTEFVQWPRVLLEHEREYLSRVMAEGEAYLKADEKARILHEITDIDWGLSNLPE